MAEPADTPTGPGAAAILAAGLGALALGLLALAGDASPPFGKALSFYAPSGALSGVSMLAVLVWLAAWAVLARRWARRDVDLAPVNIAAFTMLALSLLLTFPPFMDLLQGK